MPEADYGRKNIGLLSSDFVKTVSEGYFVDKSLLIKDMIDAGSEVTQITRPRRFGKSLNLSMIQTFFEKTKMNNSVYFKNLKIWGCGKKYRAEQGKYPVIHMNLKDPKGKSWDYTHILLTRTLRQKPNTYITDSKKCAYKKLFT